MSTNQTTVWSSVGKKYLNGLTGLMLVGFIIVHLIGNLTLFIGVSAFNGYAHFLETALHGWLIYAFEIVMIVIFAIHILTGVMVAWIDKQRARPVKYELQRDAGGASKKTLSSRTMIITGLILGAFVVLHIRMFKFGDHALLPRPDGHHMKDLFGVVLEAFKQPVWAFGFPAVMVLLGFHLRHGSWSMLQSLGWSNDRVMPVLNRIALAFAVLMAAGYIVLPLYLYFFVDPAAGQATLPGGH
ncbi:succinate dehydrogenase cytochrome b subunit [bacterium]|nr:succinate dehydrogenase cytochrome b subunit [bacterium]MBU1073768.1 succinate dehydrogenase cytochrome b subunit [bacterium]MBU1676938.1 succinate dehydrogenase cytochrome b subunit [bacterium]